MMKRLAIFLTCLLFVGVQFSQAQTVRITGTVTSSEDGMPLPGVSVVVKGTTIGGATDANGKYEINAPANAQILSVSFIGYVAQDVAIAGRAVVDVVLQPDTKQIEEVVVIGYGTGRSISSVIGSVSKVSSEKIESKPTANVLDAMQGKVAGLQIFSSSGEPTQVSSIRLHGNGSLGASSTPLYVVDGIPIATGDLTAASVSPTATGSLISLNPNDIESVTILKDASATSIYGSRAANGVIYITTKKGKRDSKSVITVNSQFGYSKLANEDFFNGFMNSKQLTDFWVATGFRTQAQVDALLTTYPYDTKWHKYYYKESAPTNQTDVSIQGGTAKTSYYVSGGYFYQDGVAIRSEYERYNVRANINSFANDWLSFGGNFSASTDNRQANGWNTNNTNRGLAMLAPPMYTPYDSEGKPYEGVIPGWNRYDPYYLARKMPSDGKNNQLNVIGFIQLTPIKGLTMKTQGGIDGYSYKLRDLQYPSYLGSLNNGRVTENYRLGVNRTITNTVEYKFNYTPDHNFIVLAGHEYVDNVYESITAESRGQTDDRLMLLSAGPNNRDVSQAKSEYAFQSFFGRLDYNFKQKYFFDFSIRQDASSRFGKDNRTATFYASGLMWNIKKEAFLENIDFVSSLSLKGSFGTSGNSEIGNYTSLAAVGTTQYSGSTGWLISDAGNPKLSWEKQQKLTVALNLSLINKFRFNIEYYNRQTKSMLIDVPQPYTSGFNSIYDNVGTLKNTGVGIEFDFDAYRTNDAYVTPYINYSYNKDEVTELFYDLPYWIIPNTGVAWVVGQPVMFYRPLFAGIDPADGAPMWYLPGADRSVTTKEATTKTFNAAALEQNTGMQRYAPQSGGFGFQAGWKGIALGVDFAFVKGKYLFNNDRYFFENPTVFSGFNQSSTVLDYWKNPGDVTTFPAYSYQFTQFDSRLIEDASFLRLKNVTLSYTLPSSILSKTKVISGVKVYVTGRNLLTWTKYSGPDPEVDSNISLGANPNTKQFTFGVSLTL